MRFVWVDAGNGADFAKLARHDIDGEFYAATDPVSELQLRLGQSRDRGHAGGLYTAWNWFPALVPGAAIDDGAGYAEWTHELVARVEQALRNTGRHRPSASFPKVQLDNENHNPDVVLAMLRRWRQLRPRHDTSWTFEPMQGGWMSPAFVQEVSSLRVRLVPQNYGGNSLEHRFESDAVLRDLTRRGFAEALVSLFYDAADLRLGWDGYAFTQGRLA